MNDMNVEELNKLVKEMVVYCKKYSIPIEHLFEILEDQKVVPMIRGKAMEYNALYALASILSKRNWSVQKLNLNAQTGKTDEDISVTHRRSGISLKIESKSGVRGSMNNGERARNIKEPHFKVKCHRSRSNISLAGTSNDRYAVDTFDVIITNPLNALIQGNTVGEDLEIIHNDKTKRVLYEFYDVDNNKDLLLKAENDWRFCIPSDIAENGFIPRTPYVKLKNDPHWRPIQEIEKRLIAIVKEKHKERS
ncbi:MAG: hypothetical protein R3E32_05195 [Chitinophagales bacterium]